MNVIAFRCFQPPYHALRHHYIIIVPWFKHLTILFYFSPSTLAMRSAGGLEVIRKAVEQLGKHHERHIMLYDPTLVSCIFMCEQQVIAKS